MQIRCFSSLGTPLDEAAFSAYVREFGQIDAMLGQARLETGVSGLRYDFCCGLRILVPEGDFRVRVCDQRTGACCFDGAASGEMLVSLEKYQIPWLLEVYRGREQVFRHSFAPQGRKVLFVFNEAIGDTLAALPYMLAYMKLHRVQALCRVLPALRGFVERCCPEVQLLPEAERGCPDDVYAAFYFSTGLKPQRFALPYPGSEVPLWRRGAEVLGLAGRGEPLRWRPGPRQLSEPYACIAVQGSTAAKGWHYPGGWDTIVGRLKELGLRVLCIDKQAVAEERGLCIERPVGAEDFTGARPLEERAELLSHAAVFIGLPSGLAWLAGSVGCPAVVIGGFSTPWYEFPEAYRVCNPQVCHGCMQDAACDYMSDPCPRHGQGTAEYLACSKAIVPEQVWSAVQEALLADSDRVANEQEMTYR